MEEAKTNEVSVAEKLKEASSQKQNLTCKRLILNKEGKALKLTYHVQILQTREQDPPDWLFPQDKMCSLTEREHHPVLSEKMLMLISICSPCVKPNLAAQIETM